MLMRRFVFVSLCILLTLGLFGCSSNTEEAAGADGKKKVTLRVAWWGGQPRHDYT
ncbi:sugar ABC transporter substrate-binding protein, partial [Bacillus licheniformis]|nr:sugar ABC transporter substrate-binding protein [Bacillus licheniformis]